LFAALGKNAARLVTEKYTAEVSVPKIGSVIRHVITEDAASISNRVTVDIKKQAVTWAFITTNDGSSDGGSEKLWIQSALRCRQNGDRVLVVIKNWDPQPRFIHTFLEAGIKVLFKSDDPFRALQSIRPRLVVISIGDQDEGVEWYDFCRTFRFPYVIVNHLTKDPTVCPVNESHAAGLHRGYTAASRVLFTGQNNLRLMEKRLGVRIPGAGIFFNPIDVDRNHCVLYPDTSQGWHIAMVGALLDIHKGQSLAIRVMNIPKWRDRPVTLHLYGKGSDESNFRSMTEELRLSNVMLHGHVHDIPEIWRVNHLLLMSSRMEGLPLVLVAAMLSGRTAVVTDIGAHAEVIDDNRTGFLATAPTVEALDEALERAWLRRFEWQQMGEDAMSFIHQFIPEDPVGHFLKMIRHLIK
jgi:glycosyltransferase involved in cell wall biosynthesis